jgi:phage-related protein
MAVQIHKLKEGKHLTIFAMGDGEKVPVLDFIEQMEQKRPKETAKLAALFTRTVEHGIPKDKQKCRTLGSKLFEFKTRGGLRIVWFWDEDKMVICTHGFSKSTQKTPRGQIERALSMKSDYFEAKSQGKLLQED